MTGTHGPDGNGGSGHGCRTETVLLAGGLGLLLGALAAIGWHYQPPSGAIVSIFGEGPGLPTAEQIGLWTDRWRPLWWPVVLGFPAVGALVGVVAALATAGRRPRAWTRAHPAPSAAALGLLLGGLAAVGWHYYPYRLSEPTPGLWADPDMSAQERDQYVSVLRAGRYAGEFDDWADRWCPAILGFPAAATVLAALLGLAAGAALRRQAQVSPAGETTTKPDADQREP